MTVVLALDLGCSPPETLRLPARAVLHVGSLKASKVEPARAWAAGHLGAGLLGVETHAVASGVPEQPLGVAAGAAGATARLAGLPRGAEIIGVAIESTIVLCPRAQLGAYTLDADEVSAQGEVALDLAAVLVEAAGLRALAWTDAVVVPARFVEAARARADRGPAGWSVTVGSELARALGVPADDWHATFAGRSRGALIAAALARIVVTRG